MAGNLEQRVEQQVLRALLEKEAELDAALEQQRQTQQRVSPSNDDEELERLREQRKRQLRMQQELQQQGMGTVDEIHDQKEFFELAKKFTKLVRVGLLTERGPRIGAFLSLQMRYYPKLFKGELCALSRVLASCRCSSSSDLRLVCARNCGPC